MKKKGREYLFPNDFIFANVKIRSKRLRGCFKGKNTVSYHMR